MNINDLPAKYREGRWLVVPVISDQRNKPGCLSIFLEWVIELNQLDGSAYRVSSVFGKQADAKIAADRMNRGVVSPHLEPGMTLIHIRNKH